MPAKRVFKDAQMLRALDIAGDGTGPFMLGADNEPEVATFGAFLYGLAPASTNIQDLFLFQGAAGKIIRIKSIILSGTAGTATNVPVILYKRTSAPSGGTQTAVTRTAKDSADGSANCQLFHYGVGTTMTPGTGTMVDGGRLNLAPAANGSIDRLMFQYTWQNDKAIVLRNANEWLAVNFNNIATPGSGAFDFSATWTEE